MIMKAYHEVRMCSKQATAKTNLPPLYQIKDCRKDLNSTIEILCFQGGYPGAFRPLIGTLQREISLMVIK